MKSMPYKPRPSSHVVEAALCRSFALVLYLSVALQRTGRLTMDDDGRFADHCRYESDGRIHEWTSDTFTKYELPHDQGPTNQETTRPSILPPLRESMVHEVNVYRLLANYTDIPVPDPKSISSGFDAAGRAYIRIERMEKTVRASAAFKRCWMPLQHRSSPSDADGPCDRCALTIHRSVDEFVQCTVLPELRWLRSRTTGLDGFVVPPQWVRMADGRERWEVKTGGGGRVRLCAARSGTGTFVAE